MKIKNLSLLIFAAWGAYANAASIDYRQGYRTGVEKYESRMLLSNDWANGIGGSIEYTIDNSSTNDAGIDQARWKDTEFQLYYKYKLSDALTITPLFLYDTAKDVGDGTRNDTFKPGIQANWTFAPGWRLDGRVRYEKKTWTKKNLHGQQDDDSTVRTDAWLRKTFNDTTDAYYNVRWDRKLNDFHYDDGGKDYFEHNFGVGYKFTKEVKAYTEIGYLGEVKDPSNTKLLKDDWRVRVGVSYSF
ncbi:oligogalacturonate-specific porin KdgM family protein [Vogesella sp. GCM10023246]|uniref:Oligogalacturonate-specific porin KdgM family protein n=1 Tax=Vogesella oryzagri TaxID=3160864 RepID=A0ABV1M1R6_9NEIS